MSPRGLSLIELVVAMALFALVAVMGMQTLNGTIRTRDALSERDSRDRDLAVALALMRSDLDRLAPVLFRAPDGPPQSALYQPAGQAGLHLSVSALPGDPSPEPFQRAEWRLDATTGALSRRAWPATSPARAGQAGSARILLTGVRRLDLRSYWPALGWIDGTSPNLPPSPPSDAAEDADAAFALLANRYSDQLPLAVEVTLTLEELGEIRLLEVMR